MLAAVQQDGRALGYASDELRNNPEIVLAAVRYRGWALDFTSDTLKNDPEIVMAQFQGVAGASIRFV